MIAVSVARTYEKSRCFRLSDLQGYQTFRLSGFHAFILGASSDLQNQTAILDSATPPNIHKLAKPLNFHAVTLHAYSQLQAFKLPNLTAISAPTSPMTISGGALLCPSFALLRVVAQHKHAIFIILRHGPCLLYPFTCVELQVSLLGGGQEGVVAGCAQSAGPAGFLGVAPFRSLNCFISGLSLSSQQYVSGPRTSFPLKGRADAFDNHVIDLWNIVCHQRRPLVGADDVHTLAREVIPIRIRWLHKDRDHIVARQVPLHELMWALWHIFQYQ